jgi:hypothetical protein
MPTKDGFTPDHPLPRFLAERADEPGIGKAWDGAVISSRILKISILVVTATALAILALGNPVALFANITASLADISVFQRGAEPTPTIQSTAAVTQPLQPILQPSARDAPTRDEIAADQSQTEISEPPAAVLLKQFQAWADQEDTQAQVVQPVQQDARAPVESVQPLQDDDAQAAQNDREGVRPVQKRRHVRRVQNARAEIRREQNARARVRREQNAGVQARPVQDARAQDQAAQNPQPPSFLQSLGLHN